MSLRWRLGAVLGLVALFGWMAIGGFFPQEQRKAAWYLPEQNRRRHLNQQPRDDAVGHRDLEDSASFEFP